MSACLEFQDVRKSYRVRRGVFGHASEVVAVAADPAYLAEDMALGRSLLLASFQDAPQEGP